MSLGGEAETVKLAVNLEHLCDLSASIEARAVGAPSEDDKIGAMCSTADGAVIARADGRWMTRQLAWVGRSQRKDIDDFKRIKAPFLRKADASTDGRVIAPGVGCGRIEQAKARATRPLRPATRKRVAILTGSIE